MNENAFFEIEKEKKVFFVGFFITKGCNVYTKI